jgi:hypothetical protein
MKRVRRFSVVFLGLLLLCAGGGMGWIVATWARPGTAHEPEPTRTLERPPAPPMQGEPLLVGTTDASSKEAELRSALDEVRAERDRLAAELAALREEERRWALLAKLEKPQRAANELAAVASVRNITSAQAQVQASARIDVDRDGVGEFGGFLELSGAVAGRMSKPLVPPVLSSQFRTLTEEGEVYRAGYLFRVYLPDARAAGVEESPTGFDARRVDHDLAETTWCLYAWPAIAGVTGTRTFFMNQAGDVLATEDARYDGPGRGPAPNAAFRGSSIAEPAVADGPGSDGATWTRVE